MSKELKEVIAYVRENIDMDHVRVTCGDIDKQHGSLASCDTFNLETSIRDLMEEYSADNELPEGWWESEAEVEDIFYALMEEPEREVRMRAVVLLPGNNKVDLVDFECDPDDIETELIEHYGHSQFMYMACPLNQWHCRHKYINACGESELIEEKML